MFVLRVTLCCLCFTGLSLVPLAAAEPVEVARLSADNWEGWAPSGKEVDCIYGDYVIRNEHLVAVIANPLATRHANMTVRGVGGMLIDLSRRDAPRDQLSAYYPAGGAYSFVDAGRVQVEVDPQSAGKGSAKGQAERMVVRVRSLPRAGQPEVTVSYELAGDSEALKVVTRYKNVHDQPIQVALQDAIRADRTFTFGEDRMLAKPASPPDFFWAYDEWFGQAYGILVESHGLKRVGGRGVVLQWTPEGAENATRTLEPGESCELVRHVIPGATQLQVRGLAARHAKQAVVPVRMRVEDPAGPVAQAKLTVKQGSQTVGWGRTDEQGQLQCPLLPGEYQVHLAALGREEKVLPLQVTESGKDGQRWTGKLAACGYVRGRVEDDKGRAIPCKVSFHGREGTADPYFGPDSGTYSVINVRYDDDGAFLQEIPPGRYDVVVSHGNEYDASFQSLEVERGKETVLTAKLRHAVQTPGWVSSDFHSHSSPSGDNTGSQFGRVLNLLAEHIEFAPCTEHNRIDSYVPHLKRLSAESRLATCTGLELTGNPLPVNHQNAFPLIHRPRTQDGGAPVTDADPRVQIERLALWDDNSPKLLQGNHPNLVQILADRDLDGKYDGGFKEMFGFMDVMELHPPAGILQPPKPNPAGRVERNPIFHWMQMINTGYRIPGVVNTDAHYNYHGSGWMRNYLKSSTDDPAKLKISEMVDAAEQGHVIMTTGPYLEVSMMPDAAGKTVAIPGQDLPLPGREAKLTIRVQCPNWMDVNRVQVWFNGRPAKALNFTRRTHPTRFAQGVVKFEQTVPVQFERDTHVIVAAAGEGLKLGPVMGPARGELIPIAVANPIYVDVDGQGFQGNGDLLDFPLPRADQSDSKE